MDRFDPIQPSDKVYRWFDFTEDFTDDDGSVYDSVGSVDEIKIVDSADETQDTTDTMHDPTKTIISGCKVGVYFQAMEDGVTYKVMVRVVGALLGETVELDGLLPVIEV